VAAGWAGRESGLSGRASGSKGWPRWWEEGGEGWLGAARSSLLLRPLAVGIHRRSLPPSWGLQLELAYVMAVT